MADETKLFRDKLHELTQLSSDNGDRLSVGMIRDAFGNLSLDDEKMQMIYAYLGQMGIEVYDPETEEMSHDGMHRPSLESYLEELDAISELPPEVELQMFHQAAQGDRQSRDVLVSRYLAAACDLAGEFERKDRRIDAEDLIQEANVGLLIAMDELEKETSLAAYRVKLLNRITQYLEERIQEMLDELSSEAKVLNRMNRLAQSVHELEEQLEHKPSIEEVSAYLDLTTEEIQNLLKIGGEKLTIEDI